MEFLFLSFFKDVDDYRDVMVTDVLVKTSYINVVAWVDVFSAAVVENLLILSVGEWNFFKKIGGGGSIIRLISQYKQQRLFQGLLFKLH